MEKATIGACDRPRLTFKVVLLGTAGVGKSGLLQRVRKGEWHSASEPTVGADFCQKDMSQLVRLQIWDTGGLERYRSLTPMYYRGAHACLLVYDVSNRDSFADLVRWLAEVRVGSPASIIAVVAAKCDIPANEQLVTSTEAEAWCAQENLRHYRTSAKSGEGVDEMFAQLAEDLPSQTPEKLEFPPHERLACIPAFPTDRTECLINPCNENACSIMGPPPSHISRLYASRHLYDGVGTRRRGNDVIAESMPKQAASNHRGTQLTIDGEAHTLGVDLFTAARAYLRFLDMIEREWPDLLSPNSASLAQAFPRYAKFLRLAALYPERRLHALPDVELLWKTHLIRPIHYRKEMELLFGRVVDHAELSAAAETAAVLSPSFLAETERLWELHYAEPYALDRTEEAASPADGGADSAEVLTRLPSGGEAPSWEAVAAGISVKPNDVEKDARWLPFLRTFVAKDKTEELCNDECTLKRCVEGYARFIADCKQAFRNGQPLHQTDRGEEGPTYDIDLMWHAHMMHPVAYRRDCQALGVNLDHLPWPHHH